jgi:hypothetical protein
MFFRRTSEVSEFFLSSSKLLQTFVNSTICSKEHQKIPNSKALDKASQNHHDPSNKLVRPKNNCVLYDAKLPLNSTSNSSNCSTKPEKSSRPSLAFTVAQEKAIGGNQFIIFCFTFDDQTLSSATETKAPRHFARACQGKSEASSNIVTS